MSRGWGVVEIVGAEEEQNTPQQLGFPCERTSGFNQEEKKQKTKNKTKQTFT